MNKEFRIRKKAIEILEKEKWLVWWPSRARFKQNDIFGAFDLICWKKGGGDLKFIQLTTISNLASRRRKIKNFFQKNKINLKRGIKTEIWAWNKNKKNFKIELI